MLTTEQMKTLKQVNVSVNAELTKERVKNDFSAAANNVKNDIVRMSGQKRSAYYRVFKTGMINARLLLALSQALNVSPLYYTGQEDNKKTCTVKEINIFLDTHGYYALLSEVSASQPEKTKRNRKKIVELETSAHLPENDKEKEELAKSDSFQETRWNIDVEPEDEDDDFDDVLFDGDNDFDDSIMFKVAFPDSDKFHDAADELTEEDAVLLLKSLLKRAKAGGEAENFADLVKRCLLM